MSLQSGCDDRQGLGVYWMFEYTPFHLPDWAYCGPLITPLLFAVVGLPLLAWYKLGLAPRRLMACSRVKALRRLAQCEAVMVGYCRQPDHTIKFARIMTFDRLLEISTDAARGTIRSVLLDLHGNAPRHGAKSVDEVLQPVFAFVETRSSPMQWTRQPAA